MPKLIAIKELTDNPSLNIAIDTIERNKQALIFVSSKRSAEKTAEDISKSAKMSSSELINLSEDVLKSLSKPTKQCLRLSKCVKKGIAFHHAGLTGKQKEAIEEAFRNGVIKIICCTPTLAAGLDLPAFRTVLKDLKRFSGGWGANYIPVLEYLQQAGRAGRPGKDTEGQAICVAKTEGERDELYERYILGEPEEIYSKLAVEPVLRTYVLSLVSTGFVRTKKQIIDFFSKSFWACQYGDFFELRKKIEKMLSLLEEFEFLRSNKDEFRDGTDFQDASDLDNEVYEATELGKRVAELYIDPLTAHNVITGLKNTKNQVALPFSLLHLLCSQIELRPLLRVKKKEYDLVQEKLIENEDRLLSLPPADFDPEYDEFMNSIKTTMFFDDWISEKDEVFMLEKYSIRPGEIRYKIDKADWLLYAAVELCKLMNYPKVSSELNKLRVRVKYGVKADILVLLKLKNIGRMRARKLYNNGVKTIGDLKKIDIVTLSQVIGKKTAADVKDQLGQKVEVVKENKRKGQVSLMDYQA